MFVQPRSNADCSVNYGPVSWPAPAVSVQAQLTQPPVHVPLLAGGTMAWPPPMPWGMQAGFGTPVAFFTPHAAPYHMQIASTQAGALAIMPPPYLQNGTTMPYAVATPTPTVTMQPPFAPVAHFAGGQQHVPAQPGAMPVTYPPLPPPALPPAEDAGMSISSMRGASTQITLSCADTPSTITNAATKDVAGAASAPHMKRKSELPATRLRKVVEFIERYGRRPTRKSTNASEKTLGVWLHRFTCNDDGVKDRARAAMDEAVFRRLLGTIERAPHAKQMSDRASTLANIEPIAHRALVLRGLPLRADPSGYGRKLHNLRQGRVGPDMRDEALAIVHRVIGTDPENATILSELEESILQSVRRHEENGSVMRRTKPLLPPAAAQAAETNHPGAAAEEHAPTDPLHAPADGAPMVAPTFPGYAIVAPLVRPLSGTSDPRAFEDTRLNESIATTTATAAATIAITAGTVSAASPPPAAPAAGTPSAPAVGVSIVTIQPEREEP